MKGIVRSVRWHDRTGLVWGPLTRWRDCLRRITRVSNDSRLHTDQLAYSSVAEGWASPPFWKNGRIAGRVDGVGDRNARGSLVVAILLMGAATVFIAQRGYLAAASARLYAQSRQNVRQRGWRWNRKKSHSRSKGRKKAPPRGSTDRRRQAADRSSNYRELPAVCQGSDPGNRELEVEFKGQQHVMRSTSFFTLCYLGSQDCSTTNCRMSHC